MNEPAASIQIALRIPGKWSHPRELIQRLPAGCRLTGEGRQAPANPFRLSNALPKFQPTPR